MSITAVEDGDRLLTERVRERRIAHLEIHGWEPLKAIDIIVPGPGIWNATLNTGFRAVTSIIKSQGLRYYDIRRINRGDMTPCSWDELTDEILDAIDTRLEQT